jgi:5-methylcytosine-specific restriction endonuclease McrA
VSKPPKELDEEVRNRAQNRCGYCLAPQSLTSHKLEIEHIYPASKGGSSTAENLCLGCRRCNLHKAAKIYALKMNDELQTTARKAWKLTGLFPPES